MRGRMLGFPNARVILGGEIIWASALLRLRMGSVWEAECLVFLMRGWFWAVRLYGRQHFWSLECNVSMKRQMLGFPNARVILGGEIIAAASLLKLRMGSVWDVKCLIDDWLIDDWWLIDWWLIDDWLELKRQARGRRRRTCAAVDYLKQEPTSR